MSKLSLEPGTKVNRWTILHWEKTSKRYVCQCDCGTVKKVNGYSVKSGASKSCGCYNIEQIVERSSKPLFTAMFYQEKNYSYDEWILWIKQVYENLFIKGSTTIPKGSTLQANGSGKGSLPNKEEDIVSS